VIHVVPLAFVGASITYAGAQIADLARQLAPSGHEADCGTADSSAIDVQRDATREHFHVVLAETSGSAMLAGNGAFVADFDAVLHGFMRHGVLLLGHDLWTL
jgi:hypothetical protein